MKKMTFLACAAMLTSLALTGCQNENNDPTPAGEVVKTQFSIAMPEQVGGPKRMPSTTVQDQGIDQFQGMTGITLIPFATQGEISKTDTRLGTNITSAGITPVDMEVTKADIKDRASKAKVFEDVSIPLTTASFLFYAKSMADNSTVDGKFSAGSLSSTDLTLAPSTFEFSLNQIKSDEIFDGSSHGSLLLNYLSLIACADDGQGGERSKWYQYTAEDDAAMKAMFDTYTSMNGLSSFEVARVLTDLYQSLMPITSHIATAIKTAIKNDTYATVNTTTGEVTLISDLQQFPQELNLPEGSINIQWDGTNHVFKKGLYSGMASPDKYVYPAQLWYYVNSEIKTSNKSQKTAYETNSNDWDAILDKHGDARAVNSRTRAVAIEKPIQYAVARLDVQVQVVDPDGADHKLADKSEEVTGVKKDVPLNASGFPISAVLVGGQQKVRFDFTRTDMSASDVEYTIYDKTMANASMAAVENSYSVLNHTLVLENTQNKDVMIAVEMTNNTGVDFYGVGGQLIPKEGKFYVVAKLVANDATETGKCVFKQDFKTIAKLTLKDLSKAYNTIPDLRTPQLELGFSVDLQWQTGHTYTVDFTE